MKRKLALALILAMSFNGVSAYAADTATTTEETEAAEETEETDDEASTDDGVLTVDEAVTMAVGYSRTLKSLYESNEVNELSADDTRIDLIWSEEYSEVTNLNVELKNLLYNIRNYDSNVSIEKEKIRLNIIELFASILDAEKSVDLYDEQIELNERDLKIAEVKNSLGLLSDTEYNSLKVENESDKTQKQTLENALEQAYTSLNEILGQDLSKTYTVALDIDYEPLGETDLEYTISKAVSNSQTINDKEQEVETAKYQLEYYSSDYSGGYKESKQAAYAQATRALEDAKTSMESSIRTTYNNIITAESTYQNNLATLEQKESELEVKALQLKLGKITQLEYDKAEYEIEQLENTIEQSVYSHYVLVCKYNNPDLI